MRDFGRCRTAVVTGATRGIGRAVAESLARRGFRVVITSRSISSAELAAADIAHATGADVVARRLELGDRDSVLRLGEELVRDETLRVVVNNAGLALRTAASTADDVEMHMAVNALGHVLLDELLLPRLCAGSAIAPTGLFGITSLSTVLARRRRVMAAIEKPARARTAGLLPYAASKVALHQVLRHYHQRLTPTYRNLVVGSVYPGFVGTDIYREYGAVTERLVRTIAAPPEATGELIATLATCRGAEFYNGVQRPLIESGFARSPAAATATYEAACRRLGRTPVTERL